MKTTKKRNRSRPATISRIINTDKEKFRINAGIIAMMGMTKLAIYRLLEQKRPLARLGKSFTFPSFATFLDIIFNPDMHMESSSL
jgi:hypothetical protein